MAADASASGYGRTRKPVKPAPAVATARFRTADVGDSIRQMPLGASRAVQDDIVAKYSSNVFVSSRHCRTLVSAREIRGSGSTHGVEYGDFRSRQCALVDAEIV